MSSRAKVFLVLFVTQLVLLLVLLAGFVLNFVGVERSYPSFTVPVLFIVLGLTAALWAMDPACKGQFIRSHYLRR